MVNTTTAILSSSVSDGERNLRDLGIPAIGAVPWGTHACQLFRTKQDLVEILVPFNQTGLEGGELCLWVTYDPLDQAEATAVMRESTPGFEDAVRGGQIEIATHTTWYGQGQPTTFDSVAAALVEKYRRARSTSFYGLRLTGNGSWLKRGQWDGFMRYEAAVDRIIHRYPMICLCSYSLDECDDDQIKDVLAHHDFAIMKEHDEWVLIRP